MRMPQSPAHGPRPASSFTYPYSIPKRLVAAQRRAVAAVYEGVNEFEVAAYEKHRDTKTQGHKENDVTNLLFASFSLCPCVFVSLCFYPSLNSFTASMTAASALCGYSRFTGLA